MGEGSLLMAVVTKTRSPQMTGDECARPGIGVFQRMFLLAGTSQETGGLRPSPRPVAPGPRKEGQLPSVAAAARSNISARMGIYSEGLDGDFCRAISLISFTS